MDAARLGLAAFLVLFLAGCASTVGAPPQGKLAATADVTQRATPPDGEGSAERRHAANVIARWQAMQLSGAHAGHVHINGICPYGIQDPRRPAPGLR